MSQPLEIKTGMLFRSLTDGCTRKILRELKKDPKKGRIWEWECIDCPFAKKSIPIFQSHIEKLIGYKSLEVVPEKTDC